MIISHSKKFIFAKNRKVGGSSVEMFLSNYLDPNTDIWYKWAQTNKERKVFKEKVQLGLNTASHQNAHCNISTAITEETMDYYKIIIERNPYDQYVSFYDHQAALNHSSISPHRFFSTNYNIYIEEERPIVDKIMRFERLEQEIKSLLNKIGEDFNDNLWKSINLKNNTRKHTIKEFYTKYPEKKKQVDEAAWFHINTLRYTFK